MNSGRKVECGGGGNKSLTISLCTRFHESAFLSRPRPGLEEGEKLHLRIAAITIIKYRVTNEIR